MLVSYLVELLNRTARPCGIIFIRGKDAADALTDGVAEHLAFSQPA